MVVTLTPRFLDRRTIDKAYPLVRNIVPGMTAARWTQFVRPHLVPRSPDWPRGVMTIQNAAGYILSLFAFEVRADLHGGAERSDTDLLTSLERSGYAPAGVRHFKRLEVKSGRAGDGGDGVTRSA